jgi:lipopolysaccharide biosynthesis glycosyltransferase
MNLLFAIDRDFTGLFFNCMRSILKNGGAEHYTAYILHSDLEQGQMDDIAWELNEGVSCKFIAVPSSLFADFPESKRYPKQIYYRLAAPLLLPDQLDRILYLDVDTIVINPLTSLYEMEFDGAYYIACTHTKEFLSKLNQTRLGAPKGAPYVNTGVLLMNLPVLREKINLKEIQSYTKEKRTLVLPDQDILTALYGDKIKLADTFQYNLSDRIFNLYNVDPKNKKVDVEWVRNNSSIIHYCGRNKPWKTGYSGSLGIFYHELNTERGDENWTMNNNRVSAYKN